MCACSKHKLERPWLERAAWDQLMRELASDIARIAPGAR
jgi:hypothetical protein